MSYGPASFDTREVAPPPSSEDAYGARWADNEHDEDRKAISSTAKKRGTLDSSLYPHLKTFEQFEAEHGHKFAPKWKPPGKFPLTKIGELAFDPNGAWLVDGLFPRRGVGVLFGQSGSLKSFAVLHLCTAVALGRPWAGRDTEPGAVVYIAAEGKAGLAKRFSGLRKQHDLPREISISVISVAPNLGTGSDDARALQTAIEDAAIWPALIVVDTLSQSLGAADENGAGMQVFLQNMTAIAEKLNCLALAVHHSGWGEGQRGRGGSTQFGNSDVYVRCEREKGEMFATLTFEKIKEGIAGQIVTVTVAEIDLAQNAKAQMQTTLAVTETRHSGFAGNHETKAHAASVPALQRLLIAAFDETVSTNGFEFRPDDASPMVRAVRESQVRDAYYRRIAEDPKPNDDATKLAERQRKNWNNSIKRLLDAMRLSAGQSGTGERILWSKQ